jgi:hypothetical protein
MEETEYIENLITNKVNFDESRNLLESTYQNLISEEQIDIEVKDKYKVLLLKIKNIYNSILKLIELLREVDNPEYKIDELINFAIDIFGEISNDMNNILDSLKYNISVSSDLSETETIIEKLLLSVKSTGKITEKFLDQIDKNVKSSIDHYLLDILGEENQSKKTKYPWMYYIPSTTPLNNLGERDDGERDDGERDDGERDDGERDDDNKLKKNTAFIRDFKNIIKNVYLITKLNIRSTNMIRLANTNNTSVSFEESKNILKELLYSPVSDIYVSGIYDDIYKHFGSHTTPLSNLLGKEYRNFANHVIIDGAGFVTNEDQTRESSKVIKTETFIKYILLASDKITNDNLANNMEFCLDVLCQLNIIIGKNKDITSLDIAISNVSDNDKVTKEGLRSSHNGNNNTIFTYIKIRSDQTKINPRFKVSTDKKSQIMYLGYDETPNSMYDNKNLDLPKGQFKLKDKFEYIFKKDEPYRHNYLFGPFTHIFKPSQGNSEIANDLSIKPLLDKLIDKKSVCIIGYGASGSGKTSSLVYSDFEKTEDKRNGVLIHFCNKLGMNNNYDNIELSMIELEGNIEEGNEFLATEKYKVLPITDPSILQQIKDSKIKKEKDIQLKKEKEESQKIGESQQNKQQNKIQFGGRGMGLDGKPINNNNKKKKKTSKVTKEEKEEEERYGIYTEKDVERQKYYTPHTFNYLSQQQKWMYDDKNNDPSSSNDSLPEFNSEETDLGQYIVTIMNNQRSINATTNNPVSSRSHMIIFIRLRKTIEDRPDEYESDQPYLIVCDFAGVENKFQCNDTSVIKAFRTIKNKNDSDMKNIYDEYINKRLEPLISKSEKKPDKKPELNSSVNKSFIDNIILKQKDLEILQFYLKEMKNIIKDKVDDNLSFKPNLYLKDKKTIAKIKNTLEEEWDTKNDSSSSLSDASKFGQLFFTIWSDNGGNKLKSSEINGNFNYLLYDENKKNKTNKDTATRNINAILNYIKWNIGQSGAESEVEKAIGQLEGAKNSIAIEICNDRMKEGQFINTSLENLRTFISYFIKNVQSLENGEIRATNPKFIDQCLPIQCNPNYEDCFGNSGISETSQDSATNKSSVIATTIRQQLCNNNNNNNNNSNNCTDFSSMTFCIFNVINLSQEANNPPPSPYIDISDLVNEKTRLESIGKMVSIKSLGINNNTDNVMVYRKYLTDLLQNPLIGNSTTVDSRVGVLNRSQHIEVKSMIDVLLNQKENDYNISIVNVSSLINYINNINSISTIGTMEFTDMISKFGLNRTVCNFKYIKEEEEEDINVNDGKQLNVLNNSMSDYKKYINSLSNMYNQTIINIK